MNGSRNASRPSSDSIVRETQVRHSPRFQVDQHCSTSGIRGTRRSAPRPPRRGRRRAQVLQLRELRQRDDGGRALAPLAAVLAVLLAEHDDGVHDGRQRGPGGEVDSSRSTRSPGSIWRDEPPDDPADLGLGVHRALAPRLVLAAQQVVGRLEDRAQRRLDLLAAGVVADVGLQPLQECAEPGRCVGPRVAGQLQQDGGELRRVVQVLEPRLQVGVGDRARRDRELEVDREQLGRHRRADCRASSPRRRRRSGAGPVRRTCAGTAASPGSRPPRGRPASIRSRQRSWNSTVIVRAPVSARRESGGSRKASRRCRIAS